MIESPADRLSFLSSDEFGTTATYTLGGGFSLPSIAGILNRPTIDALLPGSDVMTTDARTTFVCRSDDLPPEAAGADAGDTLAVGADLFRVLELQPDGTGMTIIILGQ